MSLEVKSFDEIVSDQVTSIQSKVPNFQFPIGSVNLAIVESNSGVGLWLQGISLQVAALTRAISSTGKDLDTWMADYGFFRNGATFSTGMVTVSRFNTSIAGTVGVGTLFQTSVGGIRFQVVEDTSNPNWNPIGSGYLMAIGVANLSIPVMCTTPGTQGNVSSGAIDQIASATFVDSVTNPQAFTNGQDDETDQSFRARFVTYINSRSLGTFLAYENAITTGNPGIFYNVAENININGSIQLGFVTVVIDDGTGNPSSALLSYIATQIDKVRALGIQFGVFPVVVLNANINIAITLSDGASESKNIQLIKDAVSNYVSSLQIAQKLPYTRLFQIIYDSSNEIQEVNQLEINGVSVDLVPNFKQRIYISAINVSVI